MARAAYSDEGYSEMLKLLPDFADLEGNTVLLFEYSGYCF